MSKQYIPDSIQEECSRLDLSDDDLRYLALHYTLLDGGMDFWRWLSKMHEDRARKIIRGDE